MNKTNHRKYPDANHQPCHLARFRKEEAKERQEAYNQLSLQDKIARLPPEPHAAKQRTKLLAQFEKQNNRPAQQAAPKADSVPDAQERKELKHSVKE